MKFSEQWLREWVSPQRSTQALADQITMAGLEVDALEPVAAAFSGVVIAEVVDKTAHPNADKLSVCQVEDGSDEPVQVVCGAPNVAVGQKVAFARVGAVLPGDFKIKKAKLRGMQSSGMICSASELGLEEGVSSGILELDAAAPVGQDFREWMGLDDVAIEIDLTPNRGDCLSVKGVAREVGVLNQLPLHEAESFIANVTHEDEFPIEIKDSARCPRYLGRVIKNVNLKVETPSWMVERLRRSGVRSIDPAVDITNYVMLELGQPLHAFDRASLKERIEVRLAREGERLVLLDGRDIALSDDTLVIADAGGALAIAGVMGGEHSGVTPQTRDIFLEAAFFMPLAVAGQARTYGLHTDASHRFERGVDPELPRQAMERATGLLLSIAGGDPGPISDVTDFQALPAVAPITLRAERLEQALGVALGADEVVDILERLGMSVGGDGVTWQVEAPSWRFDLRIEEDLIEELARIHGYNRLPVRRPCARLGLRPDNESCQPLGRLRRQLTARGYQEAITYSFVSPQWQETLLPEAVSPVLDNPISSDMSVMRASLFPGLLKTLEYNLNRQQNRVRLFETGLVFRGELDNLEQIPMLGALACGLREPEGWAASREEVDFFDLKGDLESLLDMERNDASWRFEPARHSALHPGQTARLLYRGEEAGWIGTLHPAIRDKLGLKADAVLFEVRLDTLTQGRLPAFSPLSRYPEVRRDLALLVEEDLTVQELLDCFREEAGGLLTDITLFDVYQGKGIEPGSKSLALGLTWQHPSRTLNDDEINQLVDAIIIKSEQRFGARLRS